MRIGFFHSQNDPYTTERIKYFISIGYEVFSITFPSKSPIKEINGCFQISLPDILLNRILFVKRLIYIFHINRITKSIGLDVLHVVNAQSIILAYFSASKKNRN